MASVRLVGLAKRFGNVVAVDNVDLEIADREFLVLVGPSGCGKTTCLRMIAGLEEATEGEIWIGDRLVNDVSPKDRDIAMVFQNYALYPHMSVYDNMAFGLKLRRVPKPEIQRRVAQAAEMLGLGNLLKRRPKELSGGQRQRVALGRAIVRDPAVFLMDEPLSNLDAKLRVETRAELIRLHRDQGMTTVYVTHDQVEAMTMGHRIAVMNDGRILQADTPLGVYNHPVNRFVAGFVGTPPMNFVPAQIVAKDGGLYADVGAATLRIPGQLAEKAQSYVGRQAELGVRPSDIYDASMSAVSAEPQANTTTVTVDVVEPMGADCILYVQLGDHHLVASVDSGTRAQEQAPLDIVVDMTKTHLFDCETEHAVF